MQRLASDSALRSQMGAAARQRFDDEFQADVVIDRIESIYRSRAHGHSV
jgi:glycosyltransferase involved in cell wall biosynthesis